MIALPAQLQEPPPATEARPVAQISKLSKWLDERPVLVEIDLRITRGEFVAILGANGAGKTTLLKLLSLLSPTTEGTIELFGQPANLATQELRGRIGLIGHQSMLYRELTARENYLFFARLYGLRDPQSRAQRILGLVGLADRSEDPVKTFSRGMTQRLAIGRALLHDPELILADEPFAGLDAASVASLERLLASLHSSGKTIVLVHHDIEQSLRLAERVVVLREGRLVLDQPASRLTADRILAEEVGL